MKPIRFDLDGKDGERYATLKMWKPKLGHRAIYMRGLESLEEDFIHETVSNNQKRKTK